VFHVIGWSEIAFGFPYPLQQIAHADHRMINIADYYWRDTTLATPYSSR